MLQALRHTPPNEATTRMRIRIFCLTCIWLLFTSTISYANEVEHGSKRLVLGAHLGVARATIVDDDPGDTNLRYRTGFAGGGICIVRLISILSAQTGIDFAVKGVRVDTDFPGTSETSYMSYLEIPLLLRADLPVSKRVAPYVYLGPALGIFLDAHTRFDDGRFYESNRGIEPLDIGLMLGAGTAVNIGENGAVTMDVRYNLGLRNWLSNPIGDSEVFNRAIYLTVGYRADLATLGRLFEGAPR
jgi:Outer membrane protein beta-barrel domain